MNSESDLTTYNSQLLTVSHPNPSLYIATLENSAYGILFTGENLITEDKQKTHISAVQSLLAGGGGIPVEGDIKKEKCDNCQEKGDQCVGVNCPEIGVIHDSRIDSTFIKTTIQNIAAITSAVNINIFANWEADPKLGTIKMAPIQPEARFMDNPDKAFSHGLEDNNFTKPSYQENSGLVNQTFAAENNVNVPITYNLQPTTLILSQSYDKGWRAYQIKSEYRTPKSETNLKSKIQNLLIQVFPFWYGEEIKDHVLVNNWANGWGISNLPAGKAGQLSVVSNQSPTTDNRQPISIIIIYLPQYLQYIGFILMALGILITIFYPNAKRVNLSRT